jgi:hypothetical protein
MTETHQTTFTSKFAGSPMEAQRRAYAKAGIDHKKAQKKWRPQE